jgi:hypothetical protein
MPELSEGEGAVHRQQFEAHCKTNVGASLLAMAV